MSIFALVDCNNFYASCERVFKPFLEGKPVVVLSNNDGCIIARSNEAKKLGIPMGAPFFKWEFEMRRNKVHVYSSNYELYGDMSQRVMDVLAMHCPDIEIYSIDEAFLLLDGFTWQDLNNYMLDLRQKIKQWVGLPVSIGFAHTKTLAKIANYMAKNHSDSGVFDLCDSKVREKVLSEFPIEKIWGIGRQLSIRLKDLNIHTARDLRNADPKRLRSHFSVVMEKIISELRGKSCISLETLASGRKQIISSRSFGKQVTKLEELEEAISTYAATAAEKLREQESVTRNITVFLHTNTFRENSPQYGNHANHKFIIPTADTRQIVTAAKKCLRNIYRKNYIYHKTGIILQNLMPDTVEQYDLLTFPERQQSKKMMALVDSINNLYGKDTIFYCAQGIEKPWLAHFNKRTPRYTTRWQELMKVK